MQLLVVFHCSVIPAVSVHFTTDERSISSEATDHVPGRGSQSSWRETRQPHGDHATAKRPQVLVSNSQPYCYEATVQF